ncbi:MAG: hypothetical protein ACYC40_01110 [Patescibacteria group bacterium]
MFKLIHRHFLYRWEKFYSRNPWHLILELSLLTIIIILISLVIGLNSYHPASSLKNSSSTPIINTPIDLNNPPLDLIGSLDQTNLNIKDGIILKLNFKNNSGHLLNELKLDFNVLSKNFLIDHLELIDQNNSNIIINSTELSLPDLPANLKSELSLKVYFKRKDNISKEIIWQINSGYLVNNQNLKQIFDLPSLHIASTLSVDSRAYYNSPQGDQLGAGPLPPLVNLPTNYWIFLEAKADGIFNNFIYSAKLPRGVELTGNRSILAGDFTYNKDSRQIIWRVSSIEANLSDYQAGFEVQLIPGSDQVGKILPFLNSAHYSAQEADGAKIKINEETKSPDTDLEFDSINKGQGQIAK